MVWCVLDTVVELVIEEKAKAFGFLSIHYCQFLALQLSSRENTIGKLGNDKQQLLHMVSVPKRNTAKKNFVLQSCNSLLCVAVPTEFSSKTLTCIPDICHGSHGYIRVNFFWPV